MATNPIFISHAHDEREPVRRILQSWFDRDFMPPPRAVRRAAHLFIQDVLGEAFVDGSWGDFRSTAEDQTILALAFEAVTDAWRERKDWGRIDPNQMIDAHFAAAWRYVQSLDDEDHDAVDPDKIAVLMEICDPDYVLTGEREGGENPPVDH